MHLRSILYIYFTLKRMFYNIRFYSLTLLSFSESFFLGVGFKPKSFLPVKKNTTTNEKKPKIATVCIMKYYLKYTLKS